MTFNFGLKFITLIICANIYATKAQIEAENKDALEGQTIRLACRFDPTIIDQNQKLVFYWHRMNHKKTDPVAIDGTTLESDYAIDNVFNDGRYDLVISRAQYERDNGQFECKIKVAGSGIEVKSISYTVTILIPPGPPVISPINPVAKEGEAFDLKCSSQGGSPDPVIQWFRDGQQLTGQLTKGGNKDIATYSVLSITPSIQDDHALYKCSVWNRATADKKLDAQIALTVHYKPRVKVGPFNPLNVLQSGNAEMHCSAEANPPVRSVKWMKNSQLLSNTYNHTIFTVEPSDSGIYTCICDNGITGTNGEHGKADLEIVVMHGPLVHVLSEKEATLGEPLAVKCNVASNPKPYAIVWTKEGDPYFKQGGDVLTLNRVAAEDTGKYICSASIQMKPSGGISTIEKSSNASVTIRVKHKPGETEIAPINPVAVAGKPFTLTCLSRPPGWPEPEYRWWREGNEGHELSRRVNYTFLSVHVSQEGNYYCQPYNSLGKGSVGMVYLNVNEAPSMVIPMAPQHTRKEGDKSFSLTCRGRGKPKPAVTWWQNGQEINVDNGLFRIETRETMEDSNVYSIQTTLHFEGSSRLSGSILSASDRGRYVCVFDNGLSSGARSEAVLKIEHSPVVRHSYNRVAFDLGETSVLQCKMSAYPQPKFEWYYKGKILDSYQDRYSTNTTDLGDDIHVGSLYIRGTKSADYGDYTCKASNSVGDDDEKTIIKLVKKSAPEAPTQLEFLEILSDSVTLRWTEGFNGGFSNTEFVVTYAPEGGEKWRNESCRSTNPCKVFGLESRHEYRFKVLAVNPRGYSLYSDEAKVTTKVNLKDMPNAFDSYFDRERNILFFRVDPTPLRLIAKIEVRSENSAEWRQLTSVPIMSDFEEVYLKSTPEEITDIRIVLCLQSNDSWCGYEHLVKMDSVGTYLREAKALSAEYLIMVIIVGSLVSLIIIGLLFCCCWRRRSKANKKDYEMENGTARNKVTTISPPYYPGHENKGIVNGVDDASKVSPPPIYSSTNGSANGHIPHNYYLTGEGGDPSPSGSNETAQSELWMMMKNDLENGVADPNMSYSAYGSTHMTLDPSGYPTYSYYPHEDYQPLAEDQMNNMRNNMRITHCSKIPTIKTLPSYLHTKFQRQRNMAKPIPIARNAAMNTNNVKSCQQQDKSKFGSELKNRQCKLIIMLEKTRVVIELDIMATEDLKNGFCKTLAKALVSLFT